MSSAYFIGCEVHDVNMVELPKIMYLCKSPPDKDTGYYLGTCMLNSDIIIATKAYCELVLKEFGANNPYKLNLYRISLIEESYDAGT